MTQAQKLSDLSQVFTAGPLSWRNKVINGNFDVWQRGTSLAAGTGLRYLADRWLNATTGSTVAPSQQAFALGQTDVPGNPAYFHRCVVASVAGAGNGAILEHGIEGVRTLAGQPALLSFYAKADAAKDIAIEFRQTFGTGGSPSADVNSIGVTRKTLSTAWQQFKVPVTLPPISGKTLGTGGNDALWLFFWLDAGSDFNSRTNSLGQQSGTFDIARVQLEVGTVVTPYEDVAIGETLRRCQRFFERIGDGSGGGRLHVGLAAMSNSTTGNGGPYLFKAKKRAPPSVTVNGPTLFRTLGANQGGAATLAIAEIDSNGFGWSITGSSYTQGQVNLVQAQDGQTPTIDASAEL